MENLGNGRLIPGGLAPFPNLGGSHNFDFNSRLYFESKCCQWFWFSNPWSKQCLTVFMLRLLASNRNGQKLEWDGMKMMNENHNRLFI